MRYLSYHENKRRGKFDFPIELYYVDSSHPRYEMALHWHIECELILVLQGSFSLSLDGESIELSAGESAYIPSGAIHGGCARSCIYECVVFDTERFFQDSIVCRERFNTILDSAVHVQSPFAKDSGVGRLVDRLFAGMEAEQPGYEFITTGLLWQFMGLLLQQHLYSAPSSENVHFARHAAQIKNALRHICKDYAKSMTLEELSAEADMAPKYFCRVFRQITGRTPIDYLNYYRVECAAELLCASQENVTEIALSCGFNDLSYFIRTFKRYKGVSAGTYRKQHTAYTDKEKA